MNITSVPWAAGICQVFHIAVTWLLMLVGTFVRPKKGSGGKKNDLFEVYFSIYFSIYLSIYLSFYLFLSFSFFPNSCFSFFFRRQEGIQRQTLNLSPNRFRTGSSKPPCLGMSNPQVGKLLKPMVPFWWSKARVMVPSSLRDLEYTKTWIQWIIHKKSFVKIKQCWFDPPCWFCEKHVFWYPKLWPHDYIHTL
jgi:hypothetical protein